MTIEAEHTYPMSSTPPRYLGRCVSCGVYWTVGFLRESTPDALSFADIRKTRALETARRAFDAMPVEFRREVLVELLGTWNAAARPEPEAFGNVHFLLRDESLACHRSRRHGETQTIVRADVTCAACIFLITGGGRHAS